MQVKIYWEVLEVFLGLITYITTHSFQFQRILNLNPLKIKYQTHLKSVPLDVSPHHLNLTWVASGGLGVVHVTLAMATLRKHLRGPSTAGGRLVDDFTSSLGPE